MFFQALLPLGVRFRGRMIISGKAIVQGRPATQFIPLRESIFPQNRVRKWRKVIVSMLYAMCDLISWCTLGNVSRIRVHDLRHSCASLLIHKGVSIVAVSKRLGHTSIEQTLNTYSHMLPDDQKMILETLENLGTQLGTKI